MPLPHDNWKLSVNILLHHTSPPRGLQQPDTNDAKFLEVHASSACFRSEELEDVDPFLPKPPPPPPPHPLPQSRDKTGWQRYCLGFSGSQHQEQQQQQQQKEHKADTLLVLCTSQHSALGTQGSDGPQLSSDQQQPNQDDDMMQAPEPAESSPSKPNSALESAAADLALPSYMTQLQADDVDSAQADLADAGGTDKDEAASHMSADTEPSMYAAASDTVPDAADQTMLEPSTIVVDGGSLEGRLADSMSSGNGHAQHVDAADSSSEAQLEGSSGSKGGHAAGHLPQLAVLASLDQVYFSNPTSCCLACVASLPMSGKLSGVA